MPTTAADVDVTVTSATQSLDAMKAEISGKPTAVAEPDAAAITAAREAAKQEDIAGGLDAEVLDEIDKLEPPPEKTIETAAERRARQSRQTKAILKEKAKRHKAETDTATLRAENDELKRRLAAGTTPPPTSPGQPGAAPAAASPAATEPVFAFPSWEKYQETHPDADYPAYVDARTDARYQFNDTQRAQTAFREESVRQTKQQFARIGTAEQTFKAEHADYDEVTSKVQMVGTRDDKGNFIPAPATQALQGELLKLGDKAPLVNYWLGQYPEDALALMTAATPLVFLEKFAEVKLMATGVLTSTPAAPAAKAPPAAAAATTDDTLVETRPVKPATRAPAPIAPTRGGAGTSRTLHDFDDTEDADDYIASRRQGLDA